MSTRAKLQRLTVVKLKELAKERGVTGLSGKRKDEIIDILLEEGEEEEEEEEVKRPVETKHVHKKDYQQGEKVDQVAVLLEEALNKYRNLTPEQLGDEIMSKFEILEKNLQNHKRNIREHIDNLIEDSEVTALCMLFYRKLFDYALTRIKGPSHFLREKVILNDIKQFFHETLPSVTLLTAREPNYLKFAAPKTDKNLILIHVILSPQIPPPQVPPPQIPPPYVPPPAPKKDDKELNQVMKSYEDLHISAADVQEVKMRVAKIETRSQRKDPKPVISTTPEFILQKLEDPSFLQKVATNLNALNRFKADKYEEMKAKVDKSIAEDELAITKMPQMPSHKKEEMFPMLATNQILSSKIKTLIATARATSFTSSTVKANLTEAVNNRDNGVLSLSGEARAFIRNFLCKQIFILSRGYASFTGSFTNMIFTGSPGVGKTKLAKSVGFVYGKIGILINGDTIVASPKDLVGSYIGHTAPKTVGVLMKGLENVLLIDEAYQLVPCTNGVLGTETNFGGESITEIVNFLDKFVGCSVMIVAGYSREIKNCFLDVNAGLERRFPIRWELPLYGSFELYEIFVKEVIKKIGVKFDRETAVFAYSLINQLYTANKEVFKNQAGDMINLVSLFVEEYYGNLNYEWDRSSEDKRGIIVAVLNQFLRPSGFSISV